MERESREVWMERVEQWRTSGLSAREFAEHQGLKHSALWRWSSRLRTESGRQAKVPLARVVTRTPSATGTGVVVETNGVRIHVTRGFDAETFRRVTALLSDKERT